MSAQTAWMRPSLSGLDVQGLRVKMKEKEFGGNKCEDLAHYRSDLHLQHHKRTPSKGPQNIWEYDNCKKQTKNKVRK